MSEELKYNEPWILQRADPYVYRHTDGNYYFTASIPAYDRIVLRRSETLAGLKDAEEVTVWEKHKEGIMSEHIWRRSFIIWTENGTSILRAEIKMISGQSALMCWNVQIQIRLQEPGQRKAKWDVRMQMNFLLKLSLWMQQYLKTRENITMYGLRR